MDSDATASLPTSAKLATWPFPPTPDSTLVPLPAPALPIIPFELLPPPLQHHAFDHTRTPPGPSGSSLARLLNESDLGVGRATPASLVRDGLGGAGPTGAGGAAAGVRRRSGEPGEAGPQAGYFALKGKGGVSVMAGPRPILPKAASGSKALDKLPSPPELDEEDEFELDDVEEEDDSADDDFAPPASAATVKRPRRASAQAPSANSNSAGNNAYRDSPPLNGGTSGKPSNRKVSHSLIERRRREKINDCLATLRSIVPQCREQGEAKVARAKERGRKRGRKDDAEGDKQGLHKLEILQGTIAYIEQLEAQLAALGSDATLSPALAGAYSGSPASPPSPASHPEVGARHAGGPFASVSPVTSLSPSGVEELRGKARWEEQERVASEMSSWPTVAELTRRASANLPVPDDAAAELLLGLTSPELRPIRG